MKQGLCTAVTLAALGLAGAAAAAGPPAAASSAPTGMLHGSAPTVQLATPNAGQLGTAPCPAHSAGLAMFTGEPGLSHNVAPEASPAMTFNDELVMTYNQIPADLAMSFDGRADMTHNVASEVALDMTYSSAAVTATARARDGQTGMSYDPFPVMTPDMSFSGQLAMMCDPGYSAAPAMTFSGQPGTMLDPVPPVSPAMSFNTQVIVYVQPAA
jgi:hypothetical protein